MNLVSSMLEFQNQVKIFHWQTYGYAEHQSLGSLYDNLSGFIDEFVEVFMGKYGRVLAKESFVLTLKNYKDLSPTQAIDIFINYLINDVPQMLDSAKDTDLLNIRDEILASCNKTKYLLTLR